MIKILLADDHELVRNGVRRILEDVRDFTVVGEANDGEDAVKLARKLNPDVILMDVNMPGMGGLEATKQILRMGENMKVLCLSMVKEHPVPAQVMEEGATGFITKDADPNDMIDAIYKVHSGQRYLPSDLAQSIALTKLTKADNPFDSLSTRELNIAMRLTQGEKVPDIASNLNISAKTVNTYRYRMFDKLGVTTDVELTHLALRHKLITTDYL